MTTGFWLNIERGDFELPAEHSLDELTPALLTQLGSPDSELRETSWSILGAWIERGNYGPEDLRPMHELLLGNLSSEIGSAGGDDVFARSFSALALGKIVEHDARRPFLSGSELRSCAEAGSTWLISERDLRGYVPVKGWIHTTAHAGDLLRALAEHPRLSDESVELILEAIADKITARVECVYVRMEDERLAAAAKAALARTAPAAAHDWLMRIARPAPGRLWPDLIEGSDAEVTAWHNARDFLRSLFFQLTLAGDGSNGAGQLATGVTSALESMDLGFYRVGHGEN